MSMYAVIIRLMKDKKEKTQLFLKSLKHRFDHFLFPFLVSLAALKGGTEGVEK